MTETRKIKPTLSHLKNPVHFLALGLGSGLVPKAPGTFGTLIAVPLVVLLWPVSTVAYVAVIVAMFILGVGICHYTAGRLGGTDHPAIVWDEIVGYMITLIAAQNSIPLLVIGFLLFRFFDIVKPWPISWLDKHVHGGFGIMLDDAVAGLLSLLCIQFLVNFIIKGIL